jgi:hypothetical protein
LPRELVRRGAKFVAARETSPAAAGRSGVRDAV